MDRFREILLERRDERAQLDGAVREAQPDPTLAYAPDQEVFAIIQMSNVGLSPEAQARAAAGHPASWWTRRSSTAGPTI